MLQSKIFTDGYNAYFDDLDMFNNPYCKDIDPEKWKEWDDGHAQAAEDY